MNHHQAGISAGLALLGTLLIGLHVRRVEEERADELRDAEKDLDEAVDDVDDDEAIAAGLAQIQPQIAAVAAARDQMTASLNCR